ncbi:DUF2807 domain-containing protein [Chryseobacterium suipulveris]|uniref:DUF2807 domain-containing protein n=1 Tax=Chryseobacterium suipulveris TaxID=2929800 RepID=A0ABY4BVL8_9FLAO|nr:head GIN domain-containing protein [Chryseobacterium suipulveris]UOE40585.1 DUF2807 domain-containing protein [Chryseobacterium suipulveris]
MKTIGLIAVSALSLLACNIKSESGFPLNIVPKEGSGTIVQKEFEMDFDQIKVVQSISAEVVKADQEKVVISAPSDLMDDILVENNGGELYIHFKPGVNISTRNVSAKIFAKDFNALKASSSATIIVKDKFTQDRTDISVSSSGTVKGDLEANDLSIDVSSSGDFSGKIWAVNLNSEVTSSGDVNISGKAKNANLRASSSGTLNAKNVIAENADIQASSSGDVNLSVSNSLKASASSSGDIVVIKKGALNILNKSESSGGSVTVQ